MGPMAIDVTSLGSLPGVQCIERRMQKSYLLCRSCDHGSTHLIGCGNQNIFKALRPSIVSCRAVV